MKAVILAGIHLFDVDTGASRFYPLPDHVNIHDVMVLNA